MRLTNLLHWKISVSLPYFETSRYSRGVCGLADGHRLAVNEMTRS